MHIEGAPPIDPALRAAHERATARGTARVLDISDDGTRVLALSGGALVELTRDGARGVSLAAAAGRAIVSAQYGPHGSVLATADSDGDERAALYVYDGVATREIAMDVLGVVSDRDRFAYTTSVGEHVDLWIADPSPRRLSTGTGTVPLAMSGDALLVTTDTTESRSTLGRLDIARNVATVYAFGRAVQGAVLGLRGEAYAITDARHDRFGISVAPSAHDAMHRSLVGIADTDVTALARTSDGGLVYAAADDRGVSTLHFIDAVTGERRGVLAAPTGGVIGDLRAAENAPVIAFTFSDPVQPRAAYTIDLASGRATALAVPPRRAGAVEPVRVQIAPGLSGFLYRPAARKAPVVIELHGGPEDRFLPKYSSFAQWLVSRGYAVLQVDVRGSSGYGLAFAALDDGPKRERVIDDVAHALAYVAAQPELDAERIAVLGTSYGGWLALAATLAFPDRIRGCATLGGITDLPAFLEGTAPGRRDGRRAEYGDERDPATRAFLDKLSPITRIRELRRPLLVAHGVRDPRVPFATARRFVDQAREVGVPVWSLFAADEGHWFERADNRRSYEVLVTQFLASVFASQTR